MFLAFICLSHYLTLSVFFCRSFSLCLSLSLSVSLRLMLPQTFMSNYFLGPSTARESLSLSRLLANCSLSVSLFLSLSCPKSLCLTMPQTLLRHGVQQGALQQRQLRPCPLRVGTNPGNLRHRYGTGNTIDIIASR